ncbi:putative TRL super family protein [Candidatus Termititenax persephonae]|uniref:TRL super family protein n=1 Tax=Candidatus Termititenax persephonae TaxID=2218525 RepID=A0A388TGZ7_9BACT|nr:putative TRL super family protein [Candidatus Termititenax persephonae]
MFKNLFTVMLLIISLASATPIVNTTLPLDAEKKVASGELKKGESYSGSYLWLISYGDASIKTAARNGGIKNIVYIDYQEASFLFLNLVGVAKYKTIVYGY